MPSPCHGLERSLTEMHISGMAGERHGNGMACVKQTRPHYVNEMGKTQSNDLAERHGRGTAWEWHGNSMGMARYVWIRFKRSVSSLEMAGVTPKRHSTTCSLGHTYVICCHVCMSVGTPDTSVWEYNGSSQPRFDFLCFFHLVEQFHNTKLVQ
jgi:hypothetical protein